jgi:hypothetical protein
MGSRQIVLVPTAGISVLNAGIFWRKAKTKRLFSQCVFINVYATSSEAVPLICKYCSLVVPGGGHQRFNPRLVSPLIGLVEFGGFAVQRGLGVRVVQLKILSTPAVK